jgi:hypothetical protein
MKKYYVLWCDVDKTAGMVYTTCDKIKPVSRSGVKAFKLEHQALTFLSAKEDEYLLVQTHKQIEKEDSLLDTEPELCLTCGREVEK